MGVTWTRHSVTVAGLGESAPETWADVDVVGIHVPSGQRYGSCTLEFPAAYGLADLPAMGQVVTVTLDASLLFKGTVVSYPGAIGAGSERQTARLVDVRWQLGKIRVGDKSLGEFPVVGTRIAFNLDGRPDRAAEKEVDEEEVPAAAYAWDKGPDAVPWTRKDVLEWLVSTYAASLLQVGYGGLSAAWAEATDNFVPYGLTLAQAITALARECGESWGIAPQSGAPELFVPVKPGGSSAFVVNLPEAGDDADANDAAANAVAEIRGGTSIEGATDAVEVHSGPKIIETTYSSDGENPLLVPAESPDTSRWEKAWKVDVTKYEANGLGSNLQAGARPKPWLRELATSYDAASLEPHAAGSPEAILGAGVPMRPEMCLWASAYGYRMRLVKGFSILLEEGMVLLERRTYQRLLAVPGLVPAEFVDDIWLTVATEIEEAEVAREEATAVVAGERATEMVLRHDIRPRLRYKCDIPGGADTVADPVAIGEEPPFVTHAPEEAEYYVDPRPFLEGVALAALEARRRPETFVTVKCLDLTAAVALGRKLEIGPAATGMDTDTVVVDVFYDLAQGRDMIEVTATNNLESVMG